MEFFPIHRLDVSIEDGWELTPDIKGGDRVAGISSGKAWGDGGLG